jgi:hypothetical protein
MHFILCSPLRIYSQDTCLFTKARYKDSLAFGKVNGILFRKKSSELTEYEVHHSGNLT